MRGLPHEQLRAAAGARPELTASAFLFWLSDAAKAFKGQQDKDVSVPVVLPGMHVGACVGACMCACSASSSTFLFCGWEDL